MQLGCWGLMLLQSLKFCWSFWKNVSPCTGYCGLSSLPEVQLLWLPSAIVLKTDFSLLSIFDVQIASWYSWHISGNLNNVVYDMCLHIIHIAKVVALKLIEICFFFHMCLFFKNHFLKQRKFHFNCEISVPVSAHSSIRGKKEEIFKKSTKTNKQKTPTKTNKQANKNIKKGKRGNPTVNKIALNWRLFEEQNSYLQNALF